MNLAPSLVEYFGQPYRYRVVYPEGHSYAAFLGSPFLGGDPSVAYLYMKVVGLLHHVVIRPELLFDVDRDLHHLGDRHISSPEVQGIAPDVERVYPVLSVIACGE
jgi:hypothetical protein